MADGEFWDWSVLGDCRHGGEDFEEWRRALREMGTGGSRDGG